MAEPHAFNYQLCTQPLLSTATVVPQQPETALYGQYTSDLVEVFQSIKSGNLRAAGQTLLKASIWLLSRVKELGEYRVNHPRSYR